MKNSTSVLSTFSSALAGAVISVIAFRVANVLVDKALDAAQKIDAGKIKSAAGALVKVEK